MDKINIINNSEMVYKESGEMPEDYICYLVVFKTEDGYSKMIGTFESWYDDGEGGFFDGVGAHLSLKDAYAWMNLDELEISVS